jgi:hypothetical protein
MILFKDLSTRCFHESLTTSIAMEPDGMTAALTFCGRNRLLDFRVDAGSDVNQGSYPMTFVNRLSMLTAYLAFAFVCAIVLGVI